MLKLKTKNSSGNEKIQRFNHLIIGKFYQIIMINKSHYCLSSLQGFPGKLSVIIILEKTRNKGERVEFRF